MVFFNYSTMQMAAKVVYYGPGLCGKTTNLQHIYRHTSSGSRGEMVSLETETDRTLFFDLLPLDVGRIQGFKTRIQLYTVPGQVFYNTTRKLVLKGVDGIVFVADSQRAMLQANIESFENLKTNLAEIGVTVEEMPLVLQYNKRDLKDICTVEELDAALNTGDWPHFEASAISGGGVFDTLRAVSKATLIRLKKRLSQAPSSPPPRSASQASLAAAAAASTASGTSGSSSLPGHRTQDSSSSGSHPEAESRSRLDELTVDALSDAPEDGSVEKASQPENSHDPPSSGFQRRSRRGNVDILAELEKIRLQARKEAEERETAAAQIEKGRMLSQHPVDATDDEEQEAFRLGAGEDPLAEPFGTVDDGAGDDDASGAFEVPRTASSERAGHSQPYLPPKGASLDLDDRLTPPLTTRGAAPRSSPQVNGNGRREIDQSFSFSLSPDTLERASGLSFRLVVEDSDRAVVDSFQGAIQVTDSESLKHLLLRLKIALDPTRSEAGD